MGTTPKISPERKMRQSLAFGRNLIVLAGLIFAPGLWGAVHGALTLRWPRADAKIIDANLRTFTRDSSDRRYRDEWHSFAVHYSYNVGGQDYFGGRVEPYDFGMQNSAGAQRMRPNGVILGGERHLQPDLRALQSCGCVSELLLALLTPCPFPRPNRGLGCGR